MLVLSRKCNEQIRIGDDIVITVIRVGTRSVGIGIQAPKQTRILRGELGLSADSGNSEQPGDGQPVSAPVSKSSPSSELPAAFIDLRSWRVGRQLHPARKQHRVCTLP